jgi:CHAT domain-containing protein/tetratricopeptide (TPR) repeat protein
LSVNQRASRRFQGIEEGSDQPYSDFSHEIVHASLEEQIEEINRRLSQYRDIENSLGEADTLRALGQVYQGDYIESQSETSLTRSIEAFEQSFIIYIALNNVQGQARVYFDLGELHRRSGNVSEALINYNQALEIYRQLDEYEKLPLLLQRVGDMQRQLNKLDEALMSYQKTVELCRYINSENCLNYNGQIGFFSSIGEVLNSAGEIYLERGDYAQAISHFKQAVSSWSPALNNLAWIYAAQGDYVAALEIFEFISPNLNTPMHCGEYGAPSRDDASLADQLRRSISEEEEIDSDTISCIISKFDALFGKAEMYRLLGQYNKATQTFNGLISTSLSMASWEWTGINFLLQRAIVSNSLGLNYKSASDYQSALEAYQTALNIYRDIRDLPGQAIALNNIGEIHRNQGEYAQALETYTQALSVLDEQPSARTQASIFHNLGVLYDELGQPEESLKSYQQALEIRQSINDLPGQGSTLSNIGLVYQTLGDFERAESTYQEALALRQRFGDRRGEATTLNNLALLYVESSRSEEALQLLERALNIYQELEDPISESNILDSLGTAYASSGQYEEALQAYQSALSLIQGSDNPAIERIILSNLGDLFAQQQQPEAAIIFYKSSVNLTEAIRQNLQTLPLEQQKAYTATVADTYRALADLLLQQGRIPEAQQVLDLLKLEELREFTDTRAVWTSDGLQLTAAEQTVADAHGSLIALGADLIDCERTNCPDLNTLYQRQEALVAQYDREVARFTATIRDNRADDGIFQDPESISGDAQDLLEAYAAEGETALLIYPFVLEDKLWLVWATVGNVIGSVEVPVARGDLSATVQRLGELLQTGNTRNIAELQATSQQLYDWLIAPLEGELAANDIDHLVFVNDRVTRYIPMAVLHDGDQYLLERYTLSTVLAPGATEMGDRLGPVPETPVLGLGVTRPIGDFNALPAVGPELAAIVRGPEGEGVYPGQVFLDEAFTLDALERNVAAHRVLHIATHAEFVPGRKEESYILLGDGSPLRIPDIERIERRLNNLHLVVLSACQTALGGPDQDGAEIAGLSSYFLEARRAEAVIASLWSVNDTSTSVLMQRFYALLATGGLHQIRGFAPGPAQSAQRRRPGRAGRPPCHHPRRSPPRPRSRDRIAPRPQPPPPLPLGSLHPHRQRLVRGQPLSASQLCNEQ